MPSTNPTPATDSANELRPLLGDDATATFESDPNFVNSNPAEYGSSENVEEQKAAGESYAAAARKPLDTDEDDDNVGDEDEDIDEDDDEDDLVDDDEDEDDEDDYEDDDEEDDEDEDEEDEDEVKASSVLRADGLLGYEDEAEDVRNGVDRAKGDSERAKAEEKLRDGEKDYDPYSHEDGKWLPVEKDTIAQTTAAY